MIGGAYLCYEGAEKLWEAISPHPRTRRRRSASMDPEHEDALVGGAIRTDFILSAEIMVIALDEVTDEPFLSRALILVVVALAITAGVYGAVALIVKMDDAGLRLAQTGEGPSASFGRGLVRGCRSSCRCSRRSGSPRCSGSAGTSCWSASTSSASRCLYDEVHHLEEDVDDALGAVGGVGAWLTNTAASAILGLVVGAIVVAVMHLRGGSADQDRDDALVRGRGTDGGDGEGRTHPENSEHT